MKLYAWHPRGHGPLSMFVVATSEEEARQAVKLRIEQYKKEEPSAWDYDVGRWPEDYKLVVSKPGEVAFNDND